MSRSGFYKWLEAAPKKTAKTQEQLKPIIEIHEQSRGTYGSPRVLEKLREQGLGWNRKRVARLMKEAGIRSKHCRKFKATTNSKHSLPIADNLLSRQFNQPAPNLAWVSDITYVWTEEGWLYLVVFIDLWSRKVVGWSMSDRMQSQFVVDAFEMACRRQQKSLAGLIVHSDRGSQYASDIFRKALTEKVCKQSMSRKGNCWDNAVAEGFFGTLKKEMVFHARFNTREEARIAIFDYIEVFYNRNRIQSVLSFLTPERFEQTVKTAA